MFLYSFESSHTNPLRNNNNIETDEGLSCLDIGGNHIDLDKTIICKIVLESFTYLLNEFKYINKKTCYHKIYFPDKCTFKSSLVRITVQSEVSFKGFGNIPD